MRKYILFIFLVLPMISCQEKVTPLLDNQASSQPFLSILKDETSLGVHHYKSFEVAGFLSEIEEYDNSLITLYKAVLLNKSNIPSLEFKVIENKAIFDLKLNKLSVNNDYMSVAKAKTETSTFFLYYIIKEIQNTDIDPKILNIDKLMNYFTDKKY